jgi:hypothetical protein
VIHIIYVLLPDILQVPITPGNVAQVDELFERIVEGEPGLDPATVLKIGPKRLGVESWLNLYTKILTKGKPREATSSYLIRHFVQSCESLNPSIFAAYSLQAEEGELKLTLEELISKFNIRQASQNTPRSIRNFFWRVYGRSNR